NGSVTAAFPARENLQKPAARSWPREAQLIFALAFLALVVRLPYFTQLPAFSDEVDDIYRAFLITQGKLFPLTDTSTYIGSLWSWMMAAALWISGLKLYAPRALILLMGVLTVIATYPLGRAFSAGRQRGGLVAAYLLVTSGPHVLINSHVAWSNCMTPLFSALGV